MCEMTQPTRARLLDFMDRNWFGIIAILASLFWNTWSGGAWVKDRTNAERDLQTQVAALRIDMDRMRDSYVSQAVFNVWMQAIDRRLVSIDAKLDRP